MTENRADNSQLRKVHSITVDEGETFSIPEGWVIVNVTPFRTQAVVWFVEATPTSDDAPSRVNRILWNKRGEDIDEIVLLDVECVHVEQMDDRCWWIGIDLVNGGYWAGNFHADSRGRMTFSEQERDSFEWGEDATHSGPEQSDA